MCLATNQTSGAEVLNCSCVTRVRRILLLQTPHILACTPKNTHKAKYNPFKSHFGLKFCTHFILKFHKSPIPVDVNGCTEWGNGIKIGLENHLQLLKFCTPLAKCWTRQPVWSHNFYKWYYTSRQTSNMKVQACCGHTTS